MGCCRTDIHQTAPDPCRHSGAINNKSCLDDINKVAWEMAIDLVTAQFSNTSYSADVWVRVATQKYQISLQVFGAVKQKTLIHLEMKMDICLL